MRSLTRSFTSRVSRMRQAFSGSGLDAAGAPNPCDGHLVLKLEDPIYKVLSMPDPRKPDTWCVLVARGSLPVTTPFLEAVASQPDFAKLCSSALVSIEQDCDGQHRFIRLEEAAAGGPLSLLGEAEAKALGIELLYARPNDIGPAGPTAGPAKVGDAFDFSSLVRDELAPHKGFTNYSVVPWLCLGRTQRVLLSDERTLTARHPDERILDYVSLVVNCHEESCTVTKYKVGSAVGGPQVICEAVHTWYKGDATAEKNDAIQRAIWSHLERGGSVAVHCLAGIHRAACIVACHFLYRHYVLGHAHVPSKVDDIYKKLQSVRPHVSPAYMHILREYEGHVTGTPAPHNVF